MATLGAFPVKFSKTLLRKRPDRIHYAGSNEAIRSSQETSSDPINSLAHSPCQVGVDNSLPLAHASTCTDVSSELNHAGEQQNCPIQLSKLSVWKDNNFVTTDACPSSDVLSNHSTDGHQCSSGNTSQLYRSEVVNGNEHLLSTSAPCGVSSINHPPENSQMSVNDLTLSQFYQEVPGDGLTVTDSSVTCHSLDLQQMVSQEGSPLHCSRVSSVSQDESNENCLDTIISTAEDELIRCPSLDESGGYVITSSISQDQRDENSPDTIISAAEINPTACPSLNVNGGDVATSDGSDTLSITSSGSEQVDKLILQDCPQESKRAMPFPFLIENRNGFIDTYDVLDNAMISNGKTDIMLRIPQEHTSCSPVHGTKVSSISQDESDENCQGTATFIHSTAENEPTVCPSLSEIGGDLTTSHGSSASNALLGSEQVEKLVLPGCPQGNKPAAPFPSAVEKRDFFASIVTTKEKTEILQIVRRKRPKRVFLRDDHPDILKINDLANALNNLRMKGNDAKAKLTVAMREVSANIAIELYHNGEYVFCHLFIQDICFAIGCGDQVGSAVTRAYKDALKELLQPHHRVLCVGFGVKRLEQLEPKEQTRFYSVKLGGASPDMSCFTPSHRTVAQETLAKFVIKEPRSSHRKCLTSMKILEDSAKANKEMSLKFECSIKDNLARCVVTLQNVVLADVRDVSKQVTKDIASDLALQRLKNLCWTIKAKSEIDFQLVPKFSKQGILSILNEHASGSMSCEDFGKKYTYHEPKDGNDNEDFSESLESKLDDQDRLFNQISAGEFCKLISKFLKIFIKAEEHLDVIFSNEFTSDERALMHDVCNQFHLKNESKGKGKNRFLYVYKEKQVADLLNILRTVGGETPRYHLIPPRQSVTRTSRNSSNSVSVHFAGFEPQSQKSSLKTFVTPDSKSTQGTELETGSPLNLLSGMEQGMSSTPSRNTHLPGAQENEPDLDTQPTPDAGLLLSEGEAEVISELSHLVNVLPYDHPNVVTIRNLAYIVSFSKRQAANRMIHRAADRISASVTCKMIKRDLFEGILYVQDVRISSGIDAKRDVAEGKAYQAALENLRMPDLFVVQTGLNKKILLQLKQFSLPVLDEDLTREEASGQFVLETFVLQEDEALVGRCEPEQILRQSAKSNNVSLQYDFAPKGSRVRCVLKLQEEKLVVAENVDRYVSKRVASLCAIQKLRKICWTIIRKTEEAYNMMTMVYRDDFVEINRGSDLDFRAEFCRALRGYLRKFVASDRQCDLLFSQRCFTSEELVVVHNECQQLCLYSKMKKRSKQIESVFAHKERTIRQLYRCLRTAGGENAQYRLIPPGGYMCSTFVIDQGPPTLNSRSDSSTPPAVDMQLLTPGVSNGHIAESASNEEIPACRIQDHCSPWQEDAEFDDLMSQCRAFDVSQNEGPSEVSKVVSVDCGADVEQEAAFSQLHEGAAYNHLIDEYRALDLPQNEGPSDVSKVVSVDCGAGVEQEAAFSQAHEDEHLKIVPFDFLEAFQVQGENPHEWELRKRFILLNFAAYPFNSIVCLSHCFMNVVLYGCVYSRDVMTLLSKMGIGVLEEEEDLNRIEGNSVCLEDQEKSELVKPIATSEAVSVPSENGEEQETVLGFQTHQEPAEEFQTVLNNEVLEDQIPGCMDGATGGENCFEIEMISTDIGKGFYEELENPVGSEESSCEAKDDVFEAFENPFEFREESSFAAREEDFFEALVSSFDTREENFYEALENPFESRDESFSETEADFHEALGSSFKSTEDFYEALENPFEFQEESSFAAREEDFFEALVSSFESREDDFYDALENTFESEETFFETEDFHEALESFFEAREDDFYDALENQCESGEESTFETDFHEALESSFEAREDDFFEALENTNESGEETTFETDFHDALESFFEASKDDFYEALENPWESGEETTFETDFHEVLENSFEPREGDFFEALENTFESGEESFFETDYFHEALDSFLEAREDDFYEALENPWESGEESSFETDFHEALDSFLEARVDDFYEALENPWESGEESSFETDFHEALESSFEAREDNFYEALENTYKAGEETTFETEFHEALESSLEATESDFCEALGNPNESSEECTSETEEFHEALESFFEVREEHCFEMTGDGYETEETGKVAREENRFDKTEENNFRSEEIGKITREENPLEMTEENNFKTQDFGKVAREENSFAMTEDNNFKTEEIGKVAREENRFAMMEKNNFKTEESGKLAREEHSFKIEGEKNAFEVAEMDGAWCSPVEQTNSDRGDEQKKRSQSDIDTNIKDESISCNASGRGGRRGERTQPDVTLKTFKTINPEVTALYAKGISELTYWTYYNAWQKENVPTLKMIRLLALSLLNYQPCDPVKHLQDAARNIAIDGRECSWSTPYTGIFSFSLILDNTIVGSGGPSTLPVIAQIEAYKCAIENILKPKLYLRYEPFTDQIFLSGYYDSDIGPATVRLPWKHQPLMQPPPLLPPGSAPFHGNRRPSQSRPEADPRHLILLENECSGSAEDILHDTAEFNKRYLRIVHDTENYGRTPNCRIFIQNRMVAYACGRSKQLARSRACVMALDELRRSCWCIKVRNVERVDIEVTRESLLGSSVQKYQAVASDSVGGRMMQKMGWKGGRLGKNGEGLLEPIHHIQKGSVKRQGLGFETMGKDFDKGKVNEFLENFASTCKPQQSLVFLAEFAEGERDYVKLQCHNLHLVVEQRKKDHGICFVVSCKWDKPTILKYLSVSKDESGKYELVAPTRFSGRLR